MNLYERLLAEADQKEDERENPARKKQRRMRAYVKSRRKAVTGGGGYVTSEEIREEQERYLANLQRLRSLMINGSRGTNGGYRLAYLRRKYPTEYAHLRDIETSSR
jgi:intein/homing endonuclease